MKGKRLSKNFWLLILFFAAFFLRIYNLENTAMFLGDQGRDAIIVKRIITFENLPAIGPPSSIGQVYLGPFYYYLIAPFLLIFKFNPVGLAAAVAFYSLFLSFVIYYFSKDLLKKELLLGLLFFMLFSPILLEFSRFSWNPNLLPYFSFLTTILFVKAIKKKSLKDFLIFGGLAGITLQLHYAFLFILPLYALYFLYYGIKEKWELKKLAKLSFSSLISFMFFISPLIIFDLRHNFLNLKNLLKLLEETKPANFSFLNNLFTALSKSLEFALQTRVFENLPLLATTFFLILFAINLKKIKEDPVFTLSFFEIAALVFAIAFFNFRPIPHYFGIIYLPIYLFLSSSILKVTRPKIFYTLLGLIFVIWLPQYKNLLKTPQTPQIPYARELSSRIQSIIKKSENIRLIDLPHTGDSTPPKYFLEISGYSILDDNTLDLGNAIVVLCKPPCKTSNVLNFPDWYINNFPNKKIDKIVKFKSLKIVKIIDGKKR